MWWFLQDFHAHVVGHKSEGEGDHGLDEAREEALIQCGHTLILYNILKALEGVVEAREVAVHSYTL